MKDHIQPGILNDVPAHSRYFNFSIDPDGDLSAALRRLADFADGEKIVIGIGKQITDTLQISIPGLIDFPHFPDAQVDVPVSESALWCWLRGSDRGELIHSGRQLIELLEGALTCESIIDAFRYDIGRDLTGYEDGTENPKGQDAIEAAFLSSDDEAMHGSSFVAVQRWVHDLNDFLSRPQDEQDETIGRRKSDNEELEEAPATAHVKRAAQEDFDPEAFILRRSMPWADSRYEGLVFVAFGKSFDAFSMLLKRMVGAEDGIVDALFSFSTPVNGSYYWCPPMLHGHPNFKMLGI